MNRNSSPNYDYIRRFSTEKLKELLRLTGGEAPTEEDDALAGAVIAELLRREEGDAGPQIDVDQAWRDFQTRFNTPDAEPRVELAPAADPAVPVRRKRRLRAVLGVAAALVLLGTAVMPPALGYENVFQMIGLWNSEHFTFRGKEGGTAVASPDARNHQLPEPDVEYPSAEEALEAYGITEPVMPVIPEGYELRTLEAYPREDDGEISILAYYVRNDDSIVVNIFGYASEEFDGATYEKDDGSVLLYQACGIEHYLFTNGEGKWNVVAWTNGRYECSIQTTLPVDELEALIDSMYER